MKPAEFADLVLKYIRRNHLGMTYPVKWVDIVNLCEEVEKASGTEGERSNTLGLTTSTPPAGPEKGAALSSQEGFWQAKFEGREAAVQHLNFLLDQTEALLRDARSESAELRASVEEKCRKALEKAASVCDKSKAYWRRMSDESPYFDSVGYARAAEAQELAHAIRALTKKEAP